jgi:hypothetical protein
MGFLANSEWGNFSQIGKIFPNLKCLWDFSPYGKNNPVGSRCRTLCGLFDFQFIGIYQINMNGIYYC